MSRLMYYQRDDETASFIRDREREMALIRAGRPFWPQVWAYVTVQQVLKVVVIPTLVVLAICGITLLVHGPPVLRLDFPIDHGVSVSGAPTHGGAK
jgi:hypothetical protein